MKTLFSVVLLGALFVPAASRADVIPPDVAVCNGKSPGDSCTTQSMAAGTCKTVKCSKPDYSMKDDSGAPGTITYDCLECSAGGEDGGPTQATSKGGGCAVARSSGAWALALAPLAALALLRRRRR